MKSLFSTVLTIFCWFPYILAAAPDNFYNNDAHIIEATARSFDRIVHKSNYTSLVEFYAPWCGHCRNLAPVMKKVGKKLDGLVQVVTVNCDVDSNKPLCGEYGIEGFPTLKVFKPQRVDLFASDDKKSKKVKGKLGKHVQENYMGERQTAPIVDFCLSRITNYVKKLGRTDKLHKLANLPHSRKAVILFSKNDRVSPVLKSIALDWTNSVQLVSVYNKKVKSIPTDGEFFKNYPGMVDKLNGLVQSIKANPSESQMVILDFDNDSIVAYDGASINKENVSKFFIDSFEKTPLEGPFSKRNDYLSKLISGKKAKPNQKKSKSKNNKKTNTSPKHDEL